jgi:phosphoribosylamine--glycine ligase
MNILILGSGGREHTFAWKIAQSDQCEQLFVAPGNAGTHAIATNVTIGVTDFEAIKELVITKAIQMVVVGPEAPLVAGIHDFFSPGCTAERSCSYWSRKTGRHARRE